MFDSIALYQIEAVCASPLRTAGEDNDTESILLRQDGIPFLPGSSLAGALRDWLGRNLPLAEKALMGSQAQEGALKISDAVFAPDTLPTLRPHLRIDGATGTATEGQFYHLAHLPTGSKFSFDLTWQGKKSQQTTACCQIEELLSALDSGAIRLGAKKTDGFGAVHLAVKRCLLDMTRADHRLAWLNESFSFSPCPLPQHKQDSLLSFVLQGQVDGLLINSGDIVERQDDKGNTHKIAAPMTEAGRYIIPGSSFKGAVRAHCLRIAPLMGISSEEIDEWFGRESLKGEKKDNGIAGSILFDEAILEQPKAVEQKRVRINRFTGGAMHQKLFSQETLAGQLTLSVHLRKPEAARLILFALRDLGLGYYTLGGGGAIGRGRVEVNTLTVTAEGKTAVLTYSPYHHSYKMDDPDRLIADLFLQKEGTQ